MAMSLVIPYKFIILVLSVIEICFALLKWIKLELRSKHADHNMGLTRQ